MVNKDDNNFFLSKNNIFIINIINSLNITSLLLFLFLKFII